MAKDYICRLVMKMSCEEPSEASTTFVRYLVEGGLVNWIYRVEDADTQEVLGYFDGDGNPVEFDTISEIIGDDLGDIEDQTAVETVDLPDPADLGGLQVTLGATPNEEDLVALAESLNNEEA